MQAYLIDSHNLHEALDKVAELSSQGIRYNASIMESPANLALIQVEAAPAEENQQEAQGENVTFDQQHGVQVAPSDTPSQQGSDLVGGDYESNLPV